MKAASQLLGDGAALRGLDGAQVLVQKEHLGIVSGEEQGSGQRSGTDDHDHVPGLQAAHQAHERGADLEAPVRRLPLRESERAVPLPPARERGQAQAPRDEAVHVLEQQHLGEEVLSRGVRLELPHRFVADLEQLFPCEGVLVFLDALQHELLVLLLEGARRTARHPSGCGRRSAPRSG